MPSSLHDSGRLYQWMPGCAPWEIPILDAPPWLLEEIDKLVGASNVSPDTLNFAANQSDRVRPERPQKPTSGGDFDAFGGQIDGREDKMFRMVWRVIVKLRRASPIRPVGEPERQLMEAEHEIYQHPMRVQNPLPGESREDGLRREGRGLDAWAAKWRYAMNRWDTKVAADAALPDPSPDLDLATRPSPTLDLPKIDPATGIPLVSAFPIDGAVIPVRDWVIPNVLLKRSVSMLIAPPGSGKSLFTLQMAIGIATGTAWGGMAPRRPEKVLILNSEDDQDEMNRRLFAAAAEMGIEHKDLVGRILMPEATALSDMVVARFDNRIKAVVRTPLLAQLRETVSANGIGVVVVDPFAETIEVDENSNSQIKWAGVLWREVARLTGSAMMLVHHTKKYASDMAGDPDAGRGGGSMIGVARVMLTLFTMTEEEAQAMDVAPEERHHFVRFDDAKQNYGLKADVRWFEKKSVTLPNGTGFDPPDSVGVLVPWVPANAIDGMSTHDLNLALDVIDRGVMDAGHPNGQFYTSKITTTSRDRWAGNVLMRMLSCSEQAAKNLIRDWLKNNVLETFDYADPIQRKTRTGVRSLSQNRPGTGRPI